METGKDMLLMDGGSSPASKNVFSLTVMVVPQRRASFLVVKCCRPRPRTDDSK